MLRDRAVSAAADVHWQQLHELKAIGTMTVAARSFCLPQPGPC